MFAPLVVLVGVISVLVAVYLQTFNRAVIPRHLTDYPAFAQSDLIPEDVSKSLLAIMKEMKDFQSNVDQSKAQGFTPTYEHAGEAQPILPSGECEHPLLFPDMSKTHCIFPQRIDIGKHFILTGGLDGMKEKVQDSIDRVSSFGRYTFISDIEKYPPVKSLFSSESFQAAAKKVCPKPNMYLDTFQFNFIMQVPGQTVAVHLDAPYFWGASRFTHPQWLLVAMVFSNLFREKFVDQIQVVGYLHDWGQVTRSDGGEFVYYQDSGKIGVVSPQYRSGTFVDGSKTLHAAKIYRPHIKAPHMPKDEDCVLRFLGGEQWAVKCDDRVMGNYTTDDLRIAIVYRARCFDNEAHAREYNAFQANPSNTLTLEHILSVFKNDLVKNHGKTDHQVDSLSGIDLAMMIMDTYVKYPLPPKELALIPWNYCAIPLLAPWTAPFFNAIC